MKYEWAVCRYHSVGELASAIEGMSRDGFRIINVLDRSSNHQDTFLVIAQKDVDAHIHASGGEVKFDNLPRQRPVADRDPSKNT